MKKYYRICQQNIALSVPYLPKENPDWRAFECGGFGDGRPDFEIVCRIGSPEILPEDKKCGTSGDFEVFSNGRTVKRLFKLANSGDSIIAEYPLSGGSRCEVTATERGFKCALDDRFLWAVTALAQLMLFKNTLFLHASYICAGDTAILFSAPCGTGKSTQAALWAEFENAGIINGDKAGICIENDSILACGLPICGTSGICRNETHPLGAVVMLSQGKENKITRLGAAESIAALTGNIYLDLLAPGERERFLPLLLGILERVPVYSFACTPDKAAVAALKDRLIKDGVLLAD